MDCNWCKQSLQVIVTYIACSFVDELLSETLHAISKSHELRNCDRFSDFMPFANKCSEMMALTETTAMNRLSGSMRVIRWQIS